MATYNPIRLRQTQQKLVPWATVTPSPRPPSGWLRTIREAIGMSTADLAARLHVLPQTVAALERGEVADTASLGTLRKAAAALDCDLVYALVPRRPLDQMVRDRARQVAEQRIEPVAHSMALESQAVNRDEVDRQIEDLARKLADRPPRGFWREA